MVLSRYYVLGVSFLAFLIFDSEFCADVDSLKLYFIVNFVPSQDTYFVGRTVRKLVPISR